VSIRPQTNPSLVDLYFDFFRPNSFYTLDVTFADGSTQTSQTSSGTPTPPPSPPVILPLRKRLKSRPRITLNLPRLNPVLPAAHPDHEKERTRPTRTIYVQRPDEFPECIEYHRSAQRSLHPPRRRGDRRFL
jgi:hypothetical protein